MSDRSNSKAKSKLKPSLNLTLTLTLIRLRNIHGRYRNLRKHLHVISLDMVMPRLKLYKIEALVSIHTDHNKTFVILSQHFSCGHPFHHVSLYKIDLCRTKKPLMKRF